MPPKRRASGLLSQTLLNELREREAKDELKKHVVKYGLWKREDDPKTTPLSLHELQSLAKYWKLHHRRGFWKNTAQDMRSLVPALHEYSLSLGQNHAPFAEVNVEEEVQEEHKVEITEERVSHVKDILKPYEGDLFSTRGNYMNGMIYLSRIHRPPTPEVQMEDNPKIEGLGALKRRLSVRLLHHKSQLQGQGSRAASKDPEENNTIEQLPANMMQKMCTAALKNLSFKDGTEVDIMDHGAVTAISSLVLSEDPETRKNCAASLCNLSVQPSLCSRLIAEGAVLALSILIEDNDEDIRQDCAAALANLTMNNGIEHALIQEGALNSAMSLLANGETAETRKMAIQTIFNLSDCPTVQQHMVDEGSSSALLVFLIDLIQSIEGSSDRTEEKQDRNDDAESIMLAAQSLDNLASCKTAREALAREGVIMVSCKWIRLITAENGIADRISKMEDYEMDIIHCFVTILYHLSCTVALKGTLVHQGVLCILVDLIDNINNENIQKRASMALSKLSWYEPNLELMIADKSPGEKDEMGETNFGFGDSSIDIVPTLINMSRSTHAIVRRCCATILCNLACIEECRFAIVNRGAVPAIISLSRLEEDVATKQDCILALSGLLSTPSLQPQLLQDGALQVILGLAQSDSADTRNRAALALSNLSAIPTSRPLAVKEGSLPALIRLAQIDQEPSTQKNVAAALCHLAELTKIDQSGESNPTDAQSILKEMEDSGISIALVSILNSQIKASRAKISANPTTQEQKNRELIPSIFYYTLSCLAVIAKSAQEQNLMSLLEKMIDDNVIKALTQAAGELTNDASRGMCARSLMLISGCTNIKQIMEHDDAGIVSALIELTRVNASQKAQKSDVPPITLDCATTLRNLSLVENIDNKTEESIISALMVMSLLRSDNNETTLICAQALYNLTSKGDVERRLSSMHQGLVWALTKMAKAENLETKRIVAHSLKNLSNDNPCRPKMAEEKAIPTVIALASHSDLDIQRASSFTIYNLCNWDSTQAQAQAQAPPKTKTKNQPSGFGFKNVSDLRIRLVKDGVIGALAKLAKIQDEEIQHNCAMALSIIAQDEGTRPKLLRENSGIAALVFLSQSIPEFEPSIFSASALKREKPKASQPKETAIQTPLNEIDKPSENKDEIKQDSSELKGKEVESEQIEKLAQIEQKKEPQSQEENVKDQDESEKDQEVVVKDQDENIKDQEVVVKNQDENMKDQDESEKNQDESEKNQEVVVKDQDESENGRKEKDPVEIKVEDNQDDNMESVNCDVPNEITEPKNDGSDQEKLNEKMPFDTNSPSENKDTDRDEEKDERHDQSNEKESEIDQAFQENQENTEQAEVVDEEKEGNEEKETDQRLIIDDTDIEVDLSLLKTMGAIEESCYACASAWQSLADVGGSHPILASEGVFPSIFALCSHKLGLATRVVCASALAKLSSVSSIHSSMVTGDGVEAILNLVNQLQTATNSSTNTLKMDMWSLEDVDTARFCSSALCNLVLNHELNLTSVKSSLITALTFLLESGFELRANEEFASSASEALRTSAMAFCEIAATLDLKSGFDLEGIMRCIILIADLEGSKLAEIKSYCAIACRRMASYEDIRQSLLQAGIISALNQLAASVGVGSQNKKNGVSKAVASSTKRDIAFSYCSLSFEEVCRTPMVEQGCVPVAIALSRTDDEEMQSRCAITLCNLTENPETRVTMVDQGIFEILAYLAQHGSHDTRKRCSVALAALSNNIDLQSRMMNGGVVQVLVDLIHGPDRDTTSSNHARLYHRLHQQHRSSKKHASVKLDSIQSSPNPSVKFPSIPTNSTAHSPNPTPRSSRNSPRISPVPPSQSASRVGIRPGRLKRAIHLNPPDDEFSPRNLGNQDSEFEDNVSPRPGSHYSDNSTRFPPISTFHSKSGRRVPPRRRRHRSEVPLEMPIGFENNEFGKVDSKSESGSESEEDEVLIRSTLPAQRAGVHRKKWSGSEKVHSEQS